MVQGYMKHISGMVRTGHMRIALGIYCCSCVVYLVVHFVVLQAASRPGRCGKIQIHSFHRALLYRNEPNEPLILAFIVIGDTHGE